MMFPERDFSKRDYDRFKLDFPYEDAHPVVVVEAPDLFTPAGLRRGKLIPVGKQGINPVHSDTPGSTVA